MTRPNAQMTFVYFNAVGMGTCVGWLGFKYGYSFSAVYFAAMALSAVTLLSAVAVGNYLGRRDAERIKNEIERNM